MEGGESGEMTNSFFFFLIISRIIRLLQETQSFDFLVLELIWQEQVVILSKKKKCGKNMKIFTFILT